jgi:hypothetical protein
MLNGIANVLKPPGLTSSDVVVYFTEKSWGLKRQDIRAPWTLRLLVCCQSVWERLQRFLITSCIRTRYTDAA